jgi:peptidoglycan/LPS O-acetylase OafA/YrhL
VQPRRFDSLDGLRALAILPVVWHHATSTPMEGFLGRGPLGVDLFFTISGFLITTLLCREREATGRVSLGRFYARRSLRIFPLYYLVLGGFVLHAVTLRPPGPVRDHFLASLPAHATYTSNWFVDFGVPHAVVFAFGWSLAAEEQFYLVWPLVLRAARGLTAPAAFMLALLALDRAADDGTLSPFVTSPLALRMVRSIATPICLGSLTALGVQAGLLSRALARRAAAPLAMSVLVIAAARGWPLPVAHLAMAALVGAVCAASDHPLRSVLEHRALRHVGVVSYGIYLLNVPVVVAAKRVVGGDRTALVFALGLAGSVVLATLTYRLVEAPLLSLRERLRPFPAEPDRR